ncbi:MAG: LysM peptidoglycan-binding domain-containing protein [bacterium]|jgi:nucleoid-associated protein YgaU
MGDRGRRKSTPEDNIAFETGTDRVVNDITGESHVRPEPVGDARVYVVQEGDTLASIAHKFYGDEGLWKRILDANRDRFDDQDRIPAGAELLIPMD